MKKTCLLTLLTCAFLAAAIPAAPALTFAEETAAADASRPDYRALTYVTLGEYIGLTVTKVEPEDVTEDEIDVRIEKEISNAGLIEEISDGIVQDGDMLDITFSGELDGTVFDSQENTTFTMGAGYFPDEFEEGLMGLEAGKTVTYPVSFPEDYTNETIAGKTASFTVTVNAIFRTPQMSDALAEQLSDGTCKTVEEYRTGIEQTLAAEKKDESETQMKSELLSQILSSSEVTGYPQELIDYVVGNLKSYYKGLASLSSMEYEDYLDQQLGMTEEEFVVQAAEYAKEDLQQELILKAIAEQEGIEVSDEEYTADCEDLAAKNNYDSAEALISTYGEGEIRIALLQEKVLSYLLEKANV